MVLLDGLDILSSYCNIEISLTTHDEKKITSDDIFEGEIRRQVKIAIDEATVIIFVVDVETRVNT
ncbi:hypothetical protein N9K77_00850 [bacterium]|nr:hypothetical protein [bacterium]